MAYLITFSCLPFIHVVIYMLNDLFETGTCDQGDRSNVVARFFSDRTTFTTRLATVQFRRFDLAHWAAIQSGSSFQC